MKEIIIKTSTKEIGFKFGLGFLGKVLENYKIDVSELMVNLKANPFKYIPVLMDESAKYYAQRHRVEYDMDVDSFIDLIDDNGGLTSGIFVEFMDAFNLSMTQDVPIDKPSTKGKEVKPKK